MKTRTPLHVLLTTVMTLALLPMLLTLSPASADQIWYQSVGRDSSNALCNESSTEDLATGWTQWAPSWAQWANDSAGGFVCNRQITWAYDTQPVSCATPSGVGGTFVVGDTGPGCGIVFYDAGSQQSWGRYMEAATADVAPSGVAPGEWCFPVYSLIAGVETINVSSASVIGSGKANTDAMIVGGCTSGAAYDARAYGTGTAPAGSWFLPSLAELNQLYAQRTVVGGFTAVFYWSSSQGVGSAWGQDFNGGGQSSTTKFNVLSVRPVRAF